MIGFRFGFRHAIPPFRFRFVGFEIIGFIDVVFGAPLALAALGNGRLHNLVVQAIRLEYQPFGHEDFRFDPCPQQLFGRHAVVAEKSAGGERRSAQDTHPAHLLCADDGSQAKIKAHRRAKRQQRADELPSVQSEKDVLVVVADFFGDFDFDSSSPPSVVNYSPMISLTILSHPLTAPTSTSRLNASEPT